MKDKNVETEGYNNNNFYNVDVSIGDDKNTRKSARRNELYGYIVEEIYKYEIIDMVNYSVTRLINAP